MGNRKQIIIFEGIATSGKTTLERMLVEKLPGAFIMDESETLMPLIDNRDATIAISHLLKIIDKIKESPEQVFIIDRLHFTHVFRTDSSLKSFGRIEEELNDHFSPLVVFLSINEELIEGRIKETEKIRGELWSKGKQGSIKERVAYYAGQQRQLEEMTKETSLPVLEVDTSNKEWDKYVLEITNFFKNPS